MAGPRILIVEDDEAIGRGLGQALVGQGYDAVHVSTGRDALADAAASPPELTLLDLGLPDAEGVEVCRRLRALVPATVVVVLTARSEEIDVVLGLDAGADDYVTKPFRLSELLARIRAHLRRAEPSADRRRIVVGDLVVDRGPRRASLGGRELDLRAKEFDLLALLVAEAGQAVSRDRIMAEVWDAHWHGSTKTLDMHMSSLRRKLGETDDRPSRITTLRGVGYRLEAR